jgi:hypothetical protein
MGGLPGMPPPIMGAPMPARRREPEPEPEAGEIEPVVSEAPAPEDDTPAQQPAELQRLASPPPIPPASRPPPPPAPLSPPPLPTSPAPTRSIPDPNRRGSVVSIGDGESSARRTSMRPPVPSGVHRQVQEEEVASDEDEAYDAPAPPPPARAAPMSPPPALPTSPPPALPMSPPPMLPTSPPPALPSGAPPAPPSGFSAPPPLPKSPPPPPRGASSHASDALRRGSLEHASHLNAAPSLHERVSSSAIRPSSRDLDLQPNLRWWRSSPLHLPPTLAGRPDAAITVEGAPASAGFHALVVRLRFEDASRTDIHVAWREDDVDETETELSQEHHFPPAAPSAETLQMWAGSIGAAVGE